MVAWSVEDEDQTVVFAVCRESCSRAVLCVQLPLKGLLGALVGIHGMRWLGLVAHQRLQILETADLV